MISKLRQHRQLITSRSWTRFLSTTNDKTDREGHERFTDIQDYQRYPNHFPLTMSVKDFVEKYNDIPAKARLEDTPVSLAGRITSIRAASKKLVFLDICNDGHNVQVLAEKKHYANAQDEADKSFEHVHECLRRGDVIGIHGFPGKSGKGELSIIPRTVQVLSPCLAPFPSSKYGVKEIDIRFRQKYLDLLTNKDIRQVFATRAKVIQYIRRYLEDRDFVEVETPILCTSAGGAAANPFKTTSRALHTDLFLLFEIGKVFRNEAIQDSYQVEWNNQVIDFSPPFKRISIIAGLENALNEPLPGMDDPELVPKLLDICHKRGVVCPKPHTPARVLDCLIGEYLEPLCTNPTFLIDHPAHLSPLAKAHRDKAHMTERFELFVGGKELCNAYTELNDPDEQRERFAAQSKDRDSGDTEAHVKDEAFCTALEYGLPPTAGFGIGIDRLVMMLTGMPHIREVILFPTMKPTNEA
ncbi:lysyl-tRNA synthetase [Thraustotheca clavata]|uniref:lysine--tRNA ligase n=1 Tax=Thraustotheca clavata TaxID=74557 RepID=A0A1V9Z7T3_9STRA|nr:lysyl-tRNA synthetase [Thraustotheca clavata]